MKLELKKWQLTDQKHLVNIYNHVARDFLSDRLPLPYTHENGREWLERITEKEGLTGLYRAIVVDKQYVGSISIEKRTDVECKNADIGYLLLSSETSKGIMTQAVAEMCTLAFNELEIERLTGLVYEPNLASRRILEKNDFCLEGVMKQAIYKANHYYDLCIYGKYKRNLKKNY